MSHVSTIDIDVTDLDALEAACNRLGSLKLMRGQREYRWWGRHEGDYPLPQGFAAADLGKCDHAITVVGNDIAYEVGVVARRDGRPGYTLLWDFYNGGYGLESHVGKNCDKLKQAYATEVATRVAKQQGMQVFEQLQQDGSIQLMCRSGY